MGILVLACQTHHLIPGHEPALGIKSEASSIHRTQTHELHLFFFPHSVSFFLGEWEEKEREMKKITQANQLFKYPSGTHRDFPSCPALSSPFHLPPPPLFRIYLSREVLWPLEPWMYMSPSLSVLSLFFYFSLFHSSLTHSVSFLLSFTPLSLCSFQLLG